VPWQRTRPQLAARFQSHPTGDIGFEQPERQEEDDKHTTKPETRKNKVRFCYLIFASNEDMYGPNGAPSVLLIWETQQI
jgi:hypothetical protein